MARVVRRPCFDHIYDYKLACGVLVLVLVLVLVRCVDHTFGGVEGLLLPNEGS